MDKWLMNAGSVVLLAMLLSACSGSGSGSGSSVASNPDAIVASFSETGVSTTLGTRGSLSQPNPAVTSNAGGAWKDYSRVEDYPKIYKYPLQFITLKSGQKLGVLVAVPADVNGNAVPGGFPAILTQNAYRIDAASTLDTFLPFGGATMVIGGVDAFMIKRGYVTVAVDVLGSGVSDGVETLLGANEQQPYGETVDWVVQQSWSNGKVGLAGTSYLGITALLTAEQHRSAVKAVFVAVPMGDAWRGIAGTGGMLNGVFLSVWMQLTQALSIQNDAAVAQNPPYADQIIAATKEHIAAIDIFYLPTIKNALAGAVGYASDDGDFWSVRSPIEHAAEIQVPTFIIGGTADIFQRDEPLLYEQLKRNVTTKLLIVPGSHVQVLLASELNSYKPPDDGAPSSVMLLLQWFDQYLRGIDSGADMLPTVTQYVSGYGENGKNLYVTATDWPHPQSSPQRLYLHGDMSLTTSLPVVGEAPHTVAEPHAPGIATGKSGNGALLIMNVSPHDGSDCSISHSQWTLGFAGVLPLPCYSDDTTVEQTQNALKYESAPMTDNYYFNGPLQADIWMSTTATEAALSVRVDDVSPDGTATPLTNGLMSAAFRAIDESRSRYLKGQMIQPWHPYTVASALPVTPGEVIKVAVEIFPAAALIRTGHKLRIAISTSNQAQGIWSTPEQAKANGGVSRIYNDPDHPSSVVLPVVPTSALN